MSVSISVNLLAEAVLIGNEVRLTATLTDAAGDPVSAASLRCRVRRGIDGPEQEKSVVPTDNVGVAKFVPDAAGYWYFRWWTQGPPPIAKEGWVEILPSVFGADPA